MKLIAILPAVRKIREYHLGQAGTPSAGKNKSGPGPGASPKPLSWKGPINYAARRRRLRKTSATVTPRPSRTMDDGSGTASVLSFTSGVRL